MLHSENILRNKKPTTILTLPHEDIDNDIKW